MQKLFRWLKFMIYLLGWLLLAAIAANAWVLISTHKLIYTQASELPRKQFALVLGTAPLTKEGRPNAFFLSRIKSAAELHASGKVDRIIVSGYQKLPSYDEPGDMKKAQVASGVDPDNIITDPAGVRTLDSILRARDVHNASDLIVVSDPFHVSRALFIARHSGMFPVAYAPGGIAQPPLWLRAREFLARITAILDLFVLKTQPRNEKPQ
jgi:SanA protein